MGRISGTAPRLEGHSGKRRNASRDPRPLLVQIARLDLADCCFFAVSVSSGFAFLSIFPRQNHTSASNSHPHFANILNFICISPKHLRIFLRPFPCPLMLLSDWKEVVRTTPAAPTVFILARIRSVCGGADFPYALKNLPF